MESQLESIWYNSKANPGDEYIEGSKYVLIAAVVFLVLFIVLRITKGKRDHAISFITILISWLAIAISLIGTISEIATL